MKKLPTLTLLMLVVGLYAFQAVFAFQDEEKPAKQDEENSSQTDAEKYVINEDPEAVKTIRLARDRLFHHQSVSADMEQLVSLGAYKFRSEGKYFSGAGFKSRLEYEVKLAKMQGKFLEVCDGQILHTRRQIGKVSNNPLASEAPDVELSRRDIQKILKETRQNLDKPEALHAAEIGIGGLPAVLASLESSMTFDAIKTETIDDQKYTVVQARWKDGKQQELLTQVGPQLGQIQGYMPDLVRIYLMQETLFPARILYLKQVSAKRDTYKPFMTIEFKNIKIDEPLPPQTFAYIAPPGVEERDETGMFLQMIKSIPGGELAPEK